ncbi:hypothetical protein [Haloferax chudinovii]|uniref:Uncharacterized protein n=1 Tax=Haloferax chudinovii TaxID=1109010 RepID=A0ABD5XLV8_9EURY
MEVGPNWPPSISVAKALLAADAEEQLELSRNCWECGWQETRVVRIDSIETTTGDAHTIKRAALVDEITAELEAIDSLETLSDALADLRRQRQLEADTAGTTDEHTEKP